MGSDWAVSPSRLGSPNLTLRAAEFLIPSSKGLGLIIPNNLFLLHLLYCHKNPLLFQVWPHNGVSSWFQALGIALTGISRGTPHPVFSGVRVAGVSMVVGPSPLPRCVPYNFILRPVVRTWILLH